MIRDVHILALPHLLHPDDRPDDDDHGYDADDGSGQMMFLVGEDRLDFGLGGGRRGSAPHLLDRLPEIADERDVVRVPQVGFRLQHPRDELDRRRVQVRADLAEVGRELVQTGQHDVGGGLPFEGRLTAEGVEEGRPQAVHVGAQVLFLPDDLLGGDVVRRAPDLPLGHLLGLEAGEAEIGHLGRAVPVEEDVGRFDVAVNKAVPARGLQAFGDPQAYLQHARLVERVLLADHLVKTTAVEEFHDDERLVLHLADLVDLNHVPMVDLGGGAGFAEEVVDELGILAQLAAHDLDRHVTPEGDIVGPVDRGHAAPTHHVIEEEVSELGRNLLLGLAVRADDDGEHVKSADIEMLMALAAGDGGHALRNPIDNIFPGHVVDRGPGNGSSDAPPAVPRRPCRTEVRLAGIIVENRTA